LLLINDQRRNTSNLKFETSRRGLSENTQDEYYTKIKQFQNYYDKPATEQTIEDIKNYLHHLLTVLSKVRQVSTESNTQTL